MSPHRLPSGGTLIDRATSVRFTHDGDALHGFTGDTLASALLANGRGLVARSFKVHRPRGVTSCGSEEPTALLTVGEGARATPNCKAPATALHEGLTARSQNAWPSLKHDAMSLNAVGGHALAAGFYYKTFISGTAKRWTRLFEPAIRRAAGMGAAQIAPDPDRYETIHRHWDVLIVGAGPAGLAAARAAAEAGLDVVIADEREGLGGSLRHDLSAIDGTPAHEWAAREADALAAMGVTVLPRTTVYGHYDGQFAAAERVSEHLPMAKRGDLPRERHWLVRPARVVLACGAIERPIVHANNDRPGVMLADAARAFAVAYGVAAGSRVVVHTNNGSAYRAVRDLHAAGVAVVAVIDARERVPDAERAIAEMAGAETVTGSSVRDTAGRLALRAVTVGAFDGSGPGRTIDCDALLASGGWTPTLHLTSQAGGAPVWDERLLAHRPGALPDDWAAIGAMDGAFDTAGCIRAGAAAGREAAEALGASVGKAAPIVAADEPVCDIPRAVWLVPGGKPKSAFVDLQHDVTAADVALAQAEGFEAVEHLKRYTTLGMATDQGKTSSVNGLAIMAAARGTTIPQAGTTRFRPPFVPIALGTIAGSDGHAPPLRRTPMQDWHEAHGGVMQNAGAWARPRAYLRNGEDVRAAYIREARNVRERVGIVDVSSLGKIEVAGPDAAEFLNRVYINGWTKLAVGRARYGVMLREDGFVLDDGTTWRLSDDRFLMTTTTANAAKVLSHMEMLHATAFPGMRVHFTSVTEQWAGMAVAGPRSRDVLSAAVPDIDWSNEAFEFMAIRNGTLDGVPVMACRLSFSGELAFEVYCGAGHGLTVWEAIMAAGEPHSIAPYGTEALGTLRIEKGHVSGPELDGRTTLHDLGLDGMASTKKPYVGSAMMHRAALTDPARPTLVGLRSVSGTPIRPGSHLVNGKQRSEGHVTSTTHSPELGVEIALGLLGNGPARTGERLTATYPLRNEAVEVEVVSPHFVDPEGGRMRG